MTTRNLLTFMALSLGGLVTVVACSTTAADEPFSTSDKFCASKAETLCNNLALKCGATVDACKTKQTSACNAAASAAAGQGRSYQSGAVQACLDKLNEVYGNQAVNATPTTEADATEVCDRVFRGPKAAMTPCASTFECSGSLICDSVCAEKVVVTLNGGCGNAGQVCDTDTYCQPLGSKNFCVAKKKDGEICGMDAPCVASERCVNHCVPKVTVSQPCDDDNGCANEAPYCDLTSMPHVCRPKYESRNPACKDYGAL
ncbi:MAG: hypothetical protein JWM74_4741 [Myxococcaceae bacterium]|nr:hypothetical protein [Myxococcaceae bacterium]